MIAQQLDGRGLGDVKEENRVKILFKTFCEVI